MIKRRYSIFYTPMTFEEAKEHRQFETRYMKKLSVSFLLGVGALMGSIAVIVGGFILLIAVYSSQNYYFQKGSILSLNYGCNGQPQLFVKTIEDIMDAVLNKTYEQSNPPGSGDPIGIRGGSDISFTVHDGRLQNRSVGSLYTASLWLIPLGSFVTVVMITAMVIYMFRPGNAIGNVIGNVIDTSRDKKGIL